MFVNLMAGTAVYRFFAENSMVRGKRMELRAEQVDFFT